ncbi:UNVERIFIED_CONTAM: hypothetical protein Slati_2621100 [Sesamum latifolium]|uniref:Uncharacterized protein n=1 Tax=Sesamum latifolium TaxID=2727402 RepID=A0AAW2VUB8_9LAMI
MNLQPDYKPCHAMQCIVDTLRVYVKALGQEINFYKSTMVFSSNTPLPVHEELARVIGFRRVDMHEKYFGLPGLVGHSQRAVFDGLRDRVCQCIFW